jgi:hypothetical protein
VSIVLDTIEQRLKNNADTFFEMNQGIFILKKIVYKKDTAVLFNIMDRNIATFNIWIPISILEKNCRYIKRDKEMTLVFPGWFTGKLIKV